MPSIYKHSIYFFIFNFVIITFSFSYQWPVSPFNQQHRIKGVFGEYRGSYFHNGIDIIASEGTSVYPVEDGIIEEIKNRGTQNETIIVNSSLGYKTTYHHLCNIPQSLDVDSPVNAGSTLLGETNSLDHVHFIDGTINTMRYNPLEAPQIIPFSDNITPTIHSAKVVENINEYSSSINELSSITIGQTGQTVDVIINASDKIPNGESSDKLGIYSIELAICNPQGDTMVTENNHYIYFESGFDYEYPMNNPIEKLVYGPGSTLSNFNYVPTNCANRDNSYQLDGNWNTIACAAGTYTIKYRVADASGNAVHGQKSIILNSPLPPDQEPGVVNVGDVSINNSQSVDVGAVRWTVPEGIPIEAGGTVYLTSSDSGTMTFELYGETNSGSILLESVSYFIPDDNQSHGYDIPYPPLEFFDNSQFLSADSYTFQGKIKLISDGELIETLENVEIENFSNYIYFDKTWSGNKNLTSDITIVEGVTVTIASGSTISLNSHTITIDESTLNIANGGALNPEIKLNSGSATDCYYPTIASAFSASTTGQSVRIKGNFSFADNFSVPSGKILYTESSSQLQFASSKYLSVSGTLNANNTTFTSSSGTWWGIKYYSTSSGSMTNCTINNATCGTWISGSSPTIQSNTYSNCERGIYIRESTATPSIESNTISNCSIQGIGILNASPSIISNEVSNSQIYLNNSNANFQNNYFNDADANSVVYIYGGSPTFFDNTITADDAMLAVNAVNGSDPWFGDDFNEDIRWKGFNILSATGDWNDGVIWADGGSTPELGYGYAGPYWCGYNSILSNSTTGYPAAAFGTSSINAAWCWWGSSSVPTNYGAVITNDEFQQPIGGGSSLAKISTPNTIIENDLSEEEILWISATKYYYKAEYNDCICILKNIINDYPESKYAFKSINLISRISRKHNKCNETEIYDEMLSSLKSSKLKTTIKSKNIQDYRMKGDYKKSIKICNEIISDNPESLNECYALFDLFNIYYKDLNDTVSAISMLNELKLKYPDNEVTTIARKDVGEKLNYERLSKKSQKLIDISDAPISSEFTLFDNYPNPFNPTTTISYNLPKQSNVCIKIYDIKGNLVKTLINERSKPQGHYTVNWNASDMSSGVYFYQIKSGNNIQMKKCLLVK